MKKLKEHCLIISILIFVLCASLYWIGIRPVLGKKECYRRAEMFRQNAISVDNAVENSGVSITRTDYEKYFEKNYDTCLMQKGLK